MMQTESLLDSEERGSLTVRKQNPRPLHPTRRFVSLFIGHRQADCLPPLCHAATPRSIRYKRGIHEGVAGSKTARFMESVV
jgi:hypothetical protein